MNLLAFVFMLIPMEGSDLHGEFSPRSPSMVGYDGSIDSVCIQDQFLIEGDLCARVMVDQFPKTNLPDGSCSITIIGRASQIEVTSNLKDCIRFREAIRSESKKRRDEISNENKEKLRETVRKVNAKIRKSKR